MDEMDEWEKSLDSESEAKLKFPVTLNDLPMSGIIEINNVKFDPPSGKKSILSRVVDISKKGRKNKKDELF